MNLFLFYFFLGLLAVVFATSEEDKSLILSRASWHPNSKFQRLYIPPIVSTINATTINATTFNATTSTSLHTSALPSGAVAITFVESSNNSTVTETFLPTTFPQFKNLTKELTTTSVVSLGRSKSTTISFVYGPSGIGWALPSLSSGQWLVPPPATLPGPTKPAAKPTLTTTTSPMSDTSPSKSTTSEAKTTSKASRSSTTIARPEHHTTTIASSVAPLLFTSTFVEVTATDGSHKTSSVKWTSTKVDHTSTIGSQVTVVPMLAWGCADSDLCDKGCLVPAILCSHRNPTGISGFPWPTPPAVPPAGTPGPSPGPGQGKPTDGGRPSTGDASTTKLQSATDVSMTTTTSSKCSLQSAPQCTQTCSSVTTSGGGMTTSCETAVCKTITACSVQATTSVILEPAPTQTPFLCQMGCATCGNVRPKDTPPSPMPFPLPSLTPIDLDTYGLTPAKRVLADPSDKIFHTNAYPEGDPDYFMCGMLGPNGPAKVVDDLGRTDPRTGNYVGLPAGIEFTLGRDSFTAGLVGLHGCTAVVVVSKAGVYLAHFWEAPAFIGSDDLLGTDQQIQFADDVLTPLDRGSGNDLPSLRDLAGPGKMFAAENEPVVLIMASRDRENPVPGNLGYPNFISQMKAQLNSLVPGQRGQPIIHDYRAVETDDELENTAAGKLLFQYDPAQPDPCRNTQTGPQPMFRIWIEGQLVASKTWPALSSQRKRNVAGLACFVSPSESLSTSTGKPGPTNTLTSPLMINSTTHLPLLSKSNSLSKAKVSESPTKSATTTKTSQSTTVPSPGPTKTKETSKSSIASSKSSIASSKSSIASSKSSTASSKPPKPTGIPSQVWPANTSNRCNVHVWEYLGQQQGQKQVYLGANITGPKGADLAFYPLTGLNFGQALSANSSAGEMSITAQALPDSSDNLRRSTGHFIRKRVSAPPTMPLFEKGPVQYEIGHLIWDTEKNTTSTACSVGKFDNGNSLDGFLALSNDPDLAILPNRQIDCRFECIVPVS